MDAAPITIAAIQASHLDFTLIMLITPIGVIFIMAFKAERA
jgi:hypothetical protein